MTPTDGEVLTAARAVAAARSRLAAATADRKWAGDLARAADEVVMAAHADCESAQARLDGLVTRLAVKDVAVNDTGEVAVSDAVAFVERLGGPEEYVRQVGGPNP